jgi:hypothetical protein
VDTSAREAGGDLRSARGGNRRRRHPARTRQVFVRLSKDEYDDLAGAAARVELTPTGYVAEAALACARSTAHVDAPLDGSDVTRAELARLQRELFAVRTALAQVATTLHRAVTVLETTGAATGAFDGLAVESRRVLHDLDAVVAVIDGRLR